MVDCHEYSLRTVDCREYSLRTVDCREYSLRTVDCREYRPWSKVRCGIHCGTARLGKKR